MIVHPHLTSATFIFVFDFLSGENPPPPGSWFERKEHSPCAKNDRKRENNLGGVRGKVCTPWRKERGRGEERGCSRTGRTPPAPAPDDSNMPGGKPPPSSADPVRCPSRPLRIPAGEVLVVRSPAVRDGKLLDTWTRWDNCGGGMCDGARGRARRRVLEVCVGRYGLGMVGVGLPREGMVGW